MGLSFKAIAVGCVLSVAVSIGALHSTFINASWMALNISVPIALFVFFLFSGIVNVLLGLLHRSLALRRKELAVVFIMLMMAATVPTEGFVQHLIPRIASAFYYASPENDWAETIQPYVKDWIAPQDPLAVRYFFEGLPAGEPIPWAVWIQPLCYWTFFFLVLCFVMVCMMVLLRKQWVEHERLVYPLVKLPLEMIQDNSSFSLIRPFFRNPLMWCGFFVPFTVLSINALHSYYNYIPSLSLGTSIVFGPSVHVPLALSFMTLGFSYFVNLQVLLGIWVFFLLITLQLGVFDFLGIAMQGQVTGFAASDLIPAHEGMGAMIVFVLFILWIARGHLLDTCRKAFLGDSRVDDSVEILSYRTAVFGILIGLVILGICLEMSGMPGRIVPWFLFVVFVLYIGLTRFVAEAGLSTIRTPLHAQPFVTSTVGTSALGDQGLVALGLTYGWILKVRIFAMAACANALKIDAEIGIGGSRRRLFVALAAAPLISLVASTWFLLNQAYRYGGINLNQYFFGSTPEAAFRDVADWLSNPTGINWEGWFYVLVGGVVMSLLLAARQYFLWWPLNALGFPIATTWVAAQIWWSIFLVWLIKGVVLQYGGPKLYQNLQPFFLGLILGNVSAGGIWLLVDGFTGMQGNVLIYF
jgi:hypothetical protein